MPDPASLLPWPLAQGAGLRDELTAAYADDQRGYHDTRHLAEVLVRLGELAVAGPEYDRTAVLLAAWFHDAVYDGERDAEERSAAWAEDVLPGLVGPEVTAEVARLVRLTESHRPADDDLPGHELSDADLGILATTPERYAEYVAAVRREYAHLPDDVFAVGRAEVLEGLASKPRLFHTDYAVQRWEERARANMTAELATLRAVTGS